MTVETGEEQLGGRNLAESWEMVRSHPCADKRCEAAFQIAVRFLVIGAFWGGVLAAFIILMMHNGWQWGN
jgi:hypothetical protein